MALPELSSPTLANQAYSALRSAIVNGELEWGARITERGLAAQLRVSATPVREALRRLEQERLVERTGPRTLKVVNVSPAVRRESAEIEAVLEGVAARMAARKISQAGLDGLDRILEAADADREQLVAAFEAGRELDPAAVERVFAHLRDFHAAVEAAAGNEQLSTMLAQVRAFSREQRLRAAVGQVVTAAPSMIARYDQHRELAVALHAHDAARAERLALEHAASSGADLAAWAGGPAGE